MAGKREKNVISYRNHPGPNLGPGTITGTSSVSSKRDVLLLLLCPIFIKTQTRCSVCSLFDRGEEKVRGKMGRKSTLVPWFPPCTVR